MRYTVYNTPILSYFLQRLSIYIFRIFGWRVEGRLPNIPKFVAIATHTSNWDFLVMLFLAFALRTNISTLGKDSLFRWPFGVFFRWCGCIPVDRSKSSNVVEAMIQVFGNSEKLILVITPEGTRKKVKYWKTGFYYIAQGAQVPIVLAFIDYRRKTAGIGLVITPTGDIEADIELIKSFYANVSGKFPEKAGDVEIEQKKIKR
ncbi:MAG: lysophospholipid acyltransferase family protein [Deltaproteobacteria bacterium]|uniref:Lysophospholipid acyltransferase family protein n=1 Tax=Candidatus Zymogenus saltonus TaxID=2844893 RepID=A0A9D8PQ00_9DELT|nr:lysophospholipid acyltransferase family protein [Candidatus Zymogenus saltonus]